MMHQVFQYLVFLLFFFKEKKLHVFADEVDDYSIAVVLSACLSICIYACI